MSIHTLAIFNDADLLNIEETSLSTLMPQGAKNQLIKMCEDYRFLVSSLCNARGLSQQVILFLLNPDSCTIAGVDEFLEKLEYWVMILDDENEQRMYADVLRYSYYEEEEILILRSSLIEILWELNEVKTKTLKKSKNPQDFLVKNKKPMQLDPEFSHYESWMMDYGSEFERDDSSYNIVPDLRGKISDDQPSFYEAFRVDLTNWQVPTKEGGSERFIG